MLLLRNRSTIYTESTLALAIALFRAFGAPVRIGKADCGAADVCDHTWCVRPLKSFETFQSRGIATFR